MTPDLRRALRFTLLWGLEAVVLRSVGHARVPDLNESQLQIRLQTDEIDIAAVDPGLFESSAEERAMWMDDLQQLERVVAFCRRFDCPTILTGGFPGSERASAGDIFKRAADKLGNLRLAVRSSDRPTDNDLAELLASVEDPRITACWDPADRVVAGESATEGLDALGEYLGVVIVRDVDESGNRTDFAEGIVPWHEIISRLTANDYSGLLAMDMSGATPRNALRSATSFLYMLREVRKKT